MGQGRKKTIRGENGRCRRRSISCESENSDVNNVLHFLTPHSPLRSGGFIPRSNSYCREATPVPSLFAPARHDSLVDYISTSNIPIKSNPIGPQRKDSISISGSLPLISTSPSTVKSNSNASIAASDLITNFYSCIFPNDIIYINGKGKEISSTLRNSILKICVQLYDDDLLQLCEVAYIEKDRKEYVRYCVSSKIQRILSVLFFNCRFENIYGVSPHSYLIFGLCNCLPELIQTTHHVLYETLLDFYECERCLGDYLEDDLYLKKAEYGQIHRLVEIWQTFVNSFYEKYSVYVFSHKTDDSSQMKLLSVKNLYKSLFLLMRISGVISKYKTSLLSGIIKLFCIDSHEIHTFFKTILTKWPYGSSKRALALLDLLEDLLIDCRILLNAEYEEDLNHVFYWLAQLINQSHAEIALKSLNILNNDFILLNYIINHQNRIRHIEMSLNKNNDYWNDVIKQVGEELFDHLLDYV